MTDVCILFCQCMPERTAPVKDTNNQIKKRPSLRRDSNTRRRSSLHEQLDPQIITEIQEKYKDVEFIDEDEDTENKENYYGGQDKQQEQMYHIQGVDSFEIDVDESINEQLIRMDLQQRRRSVQGSGQDRSPMLMNSGGSHSSGRSKHQDDGRKRRSIAGTDRPHQKSGRQHCDGGSEPESTQSSSYKSSSSRDSGKIKKHKMSKRSSQSDVAAGSAEYWSGGRVYNILEQGELQLTSTNREMEGEQEWAPDPEEVVNERGVPLTNPLLRKWLESQQKRLEPMESTRASRIELSMETENQLAQLGIQSMMDSFPDLTENETFFSKDGSYMASVQKTSESSESILPKRSFSTEGSNRAELEGSGRGYQEALNSMLMQKRNPRAQNGPIGLHQTIASDNSAAWEGIHINQVEFPSQSDTKRSGSTASLNPELFPLTARSQNSELDVDELLGISTASKQMNNLDSLTKSVSSMPPSFTNIPTIEISFYQSVKDISEITKCSDITTSQLQVSLQVETKEEKTPVKDNPPQHSTPEKDTATCDGLQTPKYDQQPKHREQQQLGSRPSPTGSENTPKIARYQQLGAPVGQNTPSHSGCNNKDHSSSACSCFDDSTPVPAIPPRTKRSLGLRRSVGGRSDCSMEDGNDQTPVVCRHGRVKPGLRALVTGSNSSSNMDESGKRGSFTYF